MALNNLVHVSLIYGEVLEIQINNYYYGFVNARITFKVYALLVLNVNILVREAIFR